MPGHCKMAGELFVIPNYVRSCVLSHPKTPAVSQWLVRGVSSQSDHLSGKSDHVMLYSMSCETVPLSSSRCCADAVLPACMPVFSKSSNVYVYVSFSGTYLPCEKKRERRGTEEGKKKGS